MPTVPKLILAVGDTITVNDADCYARHSMIVRTPDGWPATRYNDDWRYGPDGNAAEFLTDRYPPAQSVTILYLPPLPDPRVGELIGYQQMDRLPEGSIVVSVDTNVAAQLWPTDGPAGEGSLLWETTGDDERYESRKLLERYGNHRLVWTPEHQRGLDTEGPSS